ncbi:hypothetical protein [endosymbiont GvMRE of Glomus versiforme]|uniref:hypothetical protein n=1 Tax=endosymbiont GvMRE of Glomus versiforme TaxID=2039283 RepID=UPI000EE3FCB1|nr:hypothetical protein [endosymbiont GvMRE of Glomus versiforme]RHZ36513.1 hypothetical protein GvMRE_I2g504 [endosymbiont GvMRE of Glomus versiforme]
MLWLKKKTRLRNKIIIHSFFSQLAWKVLGWAILGVGLALCGGFFGNKEFISQDIFGKVYQTLTRSQGQSLHKFFLGENLSDRQNLLLYALVFIWIIILLNIIVLLINLGLRLRDKYIENNKFYLHNGGIFFLNSLARIASYVVLTLCFISAQTLILILLFISFYTWFSAKTFNKPQTENFLLWQDPLVRKIVICSTVVILLLPFVYDRVETARQQISEQASEDSFSKIGNLIKNLVNSVPLVKVIFDSLTELSSFIHWIVLIWFIRTVILNRISEYSDFWKDVDKITKQATDFKQFYYYQKLLSEASITSSKPDIPTQVKKLIILGDYGFLQITPRFLKKEYLERELKKQEHEDILREFSNKIKKIIEFINFLPSHLNPTGNNQYLQREANFLTFCLFNEFQSSEEIEHTKQLILTS